MSAVVAPANKRKGFQIDDGKCHLADIDKKLKTDDETKEAQKKTEELAKEMAKEQISSEIPDIHKPFMGAQPKLLQKPEIASEEETERATAVASRVLAQEIKAAKKVVVVLAQDAMHSKAAKALLSDSSDDAAVIETASTVVALACDWQHTLPGQTQKLPEAQEGELLIYVGTPGKYASLCLRSDRGKFDRAYKSNQLAVIVKGSCMLPVGTQEENIYGIDEHILFEETCKALRHKGHVAWGLGAGSKAGIMQKAYGYPKAEEMPKELTFSESSTGGFDCLSEYVKYTNGLKLAKPESTVKNYYDTGLTVSVMMGTVVDKGVSLLTDGDGLAMLRDASIGHIISKLNQVTTVTPLNEQKSVYNFFIGDGACRLNGGTELAFHLMEGYKTEAITNLFIFNNEAWAIEDNLVADTYKHHHLFNSSFYDLLAEHGRVAICEDELELRTTLAFLAKEMRRHLEGASADQHPGTAVKPGLRIVIVRGLSMNLPPVLGDLDPIRNSSEMKFMRSVLGEFSKGCEHRIPIYGCSAFEYIQYLHIFKKEMPEGKRYQYVCGRTDIQAAHMCGFQQPEGKCVLFINDVYGVNSLGESLRMILSGFGGRQVLVMIWHPSVMKALDNFHLHRPPMVWPNLGPTLAQFYVRKQSDALFVDYQGSEATTTKVTEALAKNTPLVVVNMLPEQECNIITLKMSLLVHEEVNESC